MADLRARAYGLAALIFAADRITKMIVEARVSAIDTIHVIPGFFDIIHSQNRGVAFGVFNDSTSEWRTVALIVLASAAVIFVSTLLWRPEKLDRWSLWGLSLVLGGATGNLFDRIMWGRVTDFLELYVGDYHWPTFNVADSAIVVGSALLILDMLRPKRQAANVP
jgi:signal peptidase II